MKKIQLIITCLLLLMNMIWAQGTYIQLPPEQNPPFDPSCGSCGMVLKVAKCTPWYVFSDRSGNPLYDSPSGTTPVRNVDLGVSFLVIERSARRLKVIEAEKVITTASNCSWNYNSKFTASQVITGWMDEDKLVLSNKCLKCCKVPIPDCPMGIFNVQGLFISSVTQTGGSFKYYSNVPGVAPSETTGSPIGMGGFGFIYKSTVIDGRKWYLLGIKPEIPFMSKEIILKGWKPEEQIEEWKHRLALEYDWENSANRFSNDSRLAVLRDEHRPSIPLGTYKSSPFVEKEYNYQESNFSRSYYYQRALGVGFRNVLIEATGSNYKVGVIKNSRGVDKKIIDPAIEIANDIMVKLLQPKVIFLMDGTESLEDQAPNIYKTISETALEIDKEIMGTAIKYNYGACVYRDKGYGANIFKAQNQISGMKDLISWLTQNLHVEGREIPADYPEAVFYGLNESFKHFNLQGSYFNPTFYVLIGDCGNHSRNDPTRLSEQIIRDSLLCNVSDLVSIQFQHQNNKTLNGVADNGKSWDIFRDQFKDILSVFGQSETRKIAGGTQEVFKNRPGSFLAYPERGTSFTPSDLSSIIREALRNYNTTLQQKLVHLVLMLRNQTASCGLARRELRQITESFIDSRKLDVDQIEQVMEWVVIYLANAASNIRITSGEPVRITNTEFDFFNPGYVCLKYDFLNGKDPYRHVIYLNNTDIEKIKSFASTIRNLKGPATRTDIQRAWQYMLVTSMGLFQSNDQVNDLTISEATSILTGFKGSSKYDKIKIGQIPVNTIFTNDLMLEYVFEWGITYGYLQSLSRGGWELRAENIKSSDAVINALLKIKGRPNINQAQYTTLSNLLVKKDIRPVAEYFKGYPSKDFDITYKLKAYWIEADFFSHGENDFVTKLLSVVPRLNK